MPQYSPMPPKGSKVIAHSGQLPISEVNHTEGIIKTMLHKPSSPQHSPMGFKGDCALRSIADLGTVTHTLGCAGSRAISRRPLSSRRCSRSAKAAQAWLHHAQMSGQRLEWSCFISWRSLPHYTRERLIDSFLPLELLDCGRK
ncbi:hypothetical protein JTE90_013601 [Oedothorax gibbosus]|uniref:Uncharacterized protein n=1 Tax=Oedothorax gibbosus TaxID=931172 RepID=A0AAV6VF72_9ARAC|nr:hypothetical protein JTE90_013601 [Oedothorax gibbosus]